MPPAAPPTIDVTVVGRNPGQRPGIRLHRVRHLDDQDRTRRHGLPVTTPARTILAQAAVLAPRDLERTIVETRRQRLVTAPSASSWRSTAGDRKAFETDRRRDADLQANGYIVLRITARQLRHEPLYVAARLGALLTR
ncbi:MAG: endonuclease domain-containing protein [Solirubrobacteraceae bacterium MAG38_C4-C5]|nr:endonuclease domain-containing protein [Candidatus Siliceabacter maunaloa]